MRVLAITTEWPTEDQSGYVPFLPLQVGGLRRAGVQVDVFVFRGRKNPAKYARAWLRLEGLLRRQNYDVLHAHFGQCGLLALRRTRPFVVSFRGDDPIGIVGSNERYTLAGHSLRAASALVARAATEAIVVSRNLLQHLPARDYHIIPDGLDLERFRPIAQHEARRLLGLDADARFVLFPFDPGNPVKRFGLAAKAVELAGVQNASILAVSGQPNQRMPLYHNAADAVILTSLHEGSSNVVKEALACNVPVVSVDVGDSAERLVGARGCVLVKQAAPDSLALALRTVLSQERPRDLRSCVLALDNNIICQQVIRVYESALAKGKRRR
jgi:glycosyltransferase involved in cell wall biosynthesis